MELFEKIINGKIFKGIVLIKLIISAAFTRTEIVKLVFLTFAIYF